METSLAALIGPIYLIFGLSILFHHKSWVKLMKDFRKEHFSLFTLSFVMIVLGMLLVHTYNVWAMNVFVLITITGWALLIKGALFFLLPGDNIKAILKMATDTWVRFGGLVHVAIGAVLCYQGYYMYFM